MQEARKTLLFLAMLAGEVYAKATNNVNHMDSPRINKRQKFKQLTHSSSNYKHNRAGYSDCT